MEKLEEKTITTEKNTLIASRVPPGDNWQLSEGRDVIKGLVPTLNKYYQTTGFKGGFRLEPLRGKLFAIETVVEALPEPEEKLWDIYGEI